MYAALHSKLEEQKSRLRFSNEFEPGLTSTPCFLLKGLLELFKIKYLGKGGGGEQVVNLSKLLTLGL
jgi:hypothetical protein